MEQDSGRRSTITEISFPGGRLVDGRIRVDPDTNVVKDEESGQLMMRPAGGGPGVIIDNCACTIEGGGSCDQAYIEDSSGDIIEIWCVDNGCGFCVGGVRPENGADFWLRFSYATEPAVGSA